MNDIQLKLVDCFVWGGSFDNCTSPSSNSKGSLTQDWQGKSFDSPLISPLPSLLLDQKEHEHVSITSQANMVVSPQGCAPSDYLLTSLDNEIIQTVVKIGRPCTPDDIMLELEAHDWGVKPTTIQRHIERLGQYKIITRIKKGVYNTVRG